MTRPIPLPKSRPASNRARASIMRSNSSTGTKPERMIVESLRESGVTGLSVNNSSIPGSPDLTFDDRKLAVFVHGCFWHRCPHCRPHMPKSNVAYWEAKFARNQARDRKVTRQLRQLGWRTMIVWECQVKSRLPSVRRRVLSALSKEPL